MGNLCTRGSGDKADVIRSYKDHEPKELNWRLECMLSFKDQMWQMCKDIAHYSGVVMPIRTRLITKLVRIRNTIWCWFQVGRDWFKSFQPEFWQQGVFTYQYSGVLWIETKSIFYFIISSVGLVIIKDVNSQLNGQRPEFCVSWIMAIIHTFLDSPFYQFLTM